jgi:hypothetical protein
MKEIIRKILVGNSVIREYATIRINDDQEIRETVWLQFGSLNLDVSRNHWLLCLEPVIFGIWLENDMLKTTPVGNAEASLCFRSEDKRGNQNTTASAELEKVDNIEEPEGCLFLFRLKKSSLHHAAFFKTWLIYARYYKKPGFVLQKQSTWEAIGSYGVNLKIVRC